MTNYTPQAPMTSAPSAHGAPLGKQRSGVNVALLSIVTLGIYWYVYIFKTNNELKNHAGVGLGGPVSLILAIFISIVPTFLLGNDVKAARAQSGLAPEVSAMTAFWCLIPLIGFFVFTSKIQNALNAYWVAEGAR